MDGRVKRGRVMYRAVRSRRMIMYYESLMIGGMGVG